MVTATVAYGLAQLQTGGFPHLRAPQAHAVPVRCGFRPGSAADGHGTPASFSARAIRATLCPASLSAKIHCTTCAVTYSRTRTRLSPCIRGPVYPDPRQLLLHRGSALR